MKNQTIIAIDPGASGGIAYFVNGKIHAVKMPKSVPEMNSFFQYLKNTYENPIVFIEKVQAYGKEDDAPGKKFAINKMLANYEQLLTVIKLTPFVFVEVYPITWQTTLGLKISKSELEETKTQRKNRYKDFAQNIFPELKVNLNTCDALCLIQFALVKIENDVTWINERMKNKNSNNLFK